MADMLTIVIPTHNRREVLCETLRRLTAMPREGVQILVFADACTDGTEESIRREFSGVRLVTSSEKLGHSVARSRAFNACETEFLLSIDDDSWPMDPDYARIILEAFNRWPEAAFLAASVFDQTHPDGAAPQSSEPYRVRNFFGCGFAVRRRVFLELGGFRSFFQYGGEELEIALRAHAHGWQIMFVPALRVYHDKTPQNRNEYEMIRSGFQNNLSACFLNEPAWICALHIFRLSWNGFRHAAKRGQLSASLSAWKDFLGRVPRLAKERKALPSRAVLSWQRLERCPPL